MPEIRVPRFNANDTEYTLIEWTVEDGTRVTAGSVVAVLETSKAATDLLATADGVVRHGVPAPAPCRPGAIIGTLVTATEPVPADPSPEPPANSPDLAPDEDVLLTRPARDLVDTHRVDADRLRRLGKRVVTRADVEQLVAQGDTTDGADTPAGEHAALVLSAAQRTVARAVAESHAHIPTAYSVVRVYVDRLRQRITAEAESSGGFVGMPEFVVKAIAGQRAVHPAVFASVDDDLSVSVRSGAHIAVTFDIGSGLFLPVVPDAERLSTMDVAALLFRYRAAAMRGRLVAADPTASNITLAIHSAAGIVHARPMVFPGHACALSLCSAQSELYLTADGRVAPREYVDLGMSYDHRLVNGQAAATFLRSLKGELEM
jgi:2-oxoglutarate dehydrogenase E2 component (dihydrolipoamide succinyltransferase)